MYLNHLTVSIRFFINIKVLVMYFLNKRVSPVFLHTRTLGVYTFRFLSQAFRHQIVCCAYSLFNPYYQPHAFFMSKFWVLIP
jgi:hypothetical protein